MCWRISLYTEASINTACSSEEFVLVAKIVSVEDEDFFLELPLYGDKICVPHCKQVLTTKSWYSTRLCQFPAEKQLVPEYVFQSCVVSDSLPHPTAFQVVKSQLLIICQRRNWLWNRGYINLLSAARVSSDYFFLWLPVFRWKHKISVFSVMFNSEGFESSCCNSKWKTGITDT